VKVAHVGSAFVLAPIGGLGQDYYIDDGGVAHNSYYLFQTDRPQDYVGGDVNYLAGRHEIKFGGGWRSTPVTSNQIWPASHLVATWVDYPNMLVQAARNYQAATRRQVRERLSHRHDFPQPRHRSTAECGSTIRSRRSSRRRCPPSPASPCCQP
jgi:hypothetical protein